MRLSWRNLILFLAHLVLSVHSFCIFKGVSMPSEDDFEILIMQGSDLDNQVADIFFQQTQWASLFESGGSFRIQIYPCPDKDFWEFPLSECLNILEKAKNTLMGK